MFLKRRVSMSSHFGILLRYISTIPIFDDPRRHSADDGKGWDISCHDGSRTHIC